jgi:four helix bundle protein
MSLVICHLSFDNSVENAMASHSFEKLEVYQLSEKLADDVWILVLKWPRLAQDTVGKQLIRACDSIGANIAEGFGKGTYADNRRFVRVSRGSLYEARHWLRRAFRRNLLSSTDTKQLRPLLDELGPRLNAYLRSIGRSTEPRPESDAAPK